MPRGIPKIGNFEPIPQSEVLGTIKPKLTDPAPQSAEYVGRSVEMTEPPPPWEVDDNCRLTPSDARRFVTVPDNWELRWINPKLLDQLGWRYWQPVLKSDPRVKTLVETMVSPEGNVRRGGTTGDILAWMYKSWVDSRRKEQQEATRRLTESAVERQEALKEDFRRQRYGPYVTLTEAKHPTHTIADGRSMTD